MKQVITIIIIFTAILLGVVAGRIGDSEIMDGILASFFLGAVAFVLLSSRH